MMKKIGISTIMLLFAMYLQAQKISVSVNAGAGIPVGSFGKGDYADATSGFAGTGGHFNITGTYNVCKHWGIQVLAGYSTFAYKGSQSLSDGYKEDSGTDSTTLYRNGSNHQWSFLVGPVYRLEAGKKIVVTASVLGGYVRTNLAGFKIYYEDYLDNAMSQRPAAGGAFGGQAGLGVQYKLTKRIGVQVNADYFYSKPDIAISYDNFVVNSGRRLTRYNESLTGINTTAGVVYLF
jgi:hypothetical protein